MIIELSNFGDNNYSCGMELVILKVDNLQEVIDSDCYFLNPSAQWDCEEEKQVFALKGTNEQYKVLYKKQRDAQIAEKMMDHFGWDTTNVDPKNWREYENKVEAEYKDWWVL